MGIQPTNIPQIDFRNPNLSMSQPGMPGGSNYSPAGAANAKRQAKFGQGTNSSGANYNAFLDKNNPENYRSFGNQPARWYGAPSAGPGFNGGGRDDNRFALGGQGNYGNSVQRPRDYNNQPRQGSNSNVGLNRPYNPTSMQRPNPLYNMPQTQTKPSNYNGFQSVGGKAPSFYQNGYGTKEGYAGMNPSLDAATAAIYANPVYWQ